MSRAFLSMRSSEGCGHVASRDPSQRTGGICARIQLTPRVGFKPPATISQDQNTARYDGSTGVLATKGRHDPCVVPRAVPIVETMAALVVME